MPLHECLIWPVNPDDIDLKNCSDSSEEYKISHKQLIVITIRSFTSMNYADFR